jgi:hypothetical protein
LATRKFEIGQAQSITYIDLALMGVKIVGIGGHSGKVMTPASCSLIPCHARQADYSRLAGRIGGNIGSEP